MERHDFESLVSALARAGMVAIRADVFEKDGRSIPFHLSSCERDNTTLITRQNGTNGMGWTGAAKTMAFDRDTGGKTEHFYGCGMHWRHFDLRGLDIQLFQIDPNLNKGSLDGSAITVVPYYWSTAGYGMLLHNSFVSHFDFGKTNPASIAWNVPGGELDFYFLKGPAFKKIIQSYCDLTGYLELPPKKALGLTYRVQGNIARQDRLQRACAARIMAAGGRAPNQRRRPLPANVPRSLASTSMIHPANNLKGICYV